MTLVWLLLSLALVPAIIVPLTQALGRRTGWVLAAAFVALALALIPHARTVLDGGSVEQTYAWVPALDIEFALRLDGLGLVFVMIALLIGAAVFAYSAEYLSPGRHLGFFLWMTVFALGMVGLVLADDLILLFLCWEITSLASFLLIARSGSGGEAASVRTLLITFIGGLALLVAVVVMIVATGTTRLSEALASPVWHDHGPLTTTVAVLVAISGFTKAAQFPFHPWLPDAMAASTPVSAYLHAAAVVKAGIYLMMRFSEAFSSVPTWNALLIVVGLFTSAMAAIFALNQTDLKRLMAYSTVSQLGLITAAIGIGTPKALTAAVIHTIAHALFKSGLFMMVGVIDHQAGTRDLRRLPALRHVMPWSFATVAAGTAAMAGLPPLLGFISKEAILGSMLEAPGPAWTGPAAFTFAGLGAVLTFAYCAKILFHAFVDGERDLEPEMCEASPALLAPAMLTIWAGLPLALAVGVLAGPVEQAVSAMSGAESYELALWHGVTPELIVTGLVVLVGLVLITQRAKLRPRLQRDLLPFSGVGLIDRGLHRVDRIGALSARAVGYDHPARHVIPPMAMLTLLLGGGTIAVFSGGDVPSTVPDLWRPVDAALLVLITVAVIGVCLADSRLSATVFLGGVGIAVTVQLFALGAPDVGLTQLMVEVLTVIFIMLVLRGLPSRFGHLRHSRRRGPIVLATALGLAAGGATWLLTGRRDPSAPAEYFLSEGAEESGGDNLVNVILVEFRALDTLGELTVLGFAAVAILAILATVPARTPGGQEPQRYDLRPLGALDDPQAARALEDAAANLAPMRLLLRLLVPGLIVLSVLIFWRGHNAPGGGFIAALVAAVAVSLVYLSRPEDRAVGTPRLNLGLVAGGVITALGSGLLGYTSSSFLEPLSTYVVGIYVGTSLLFDVGVYIAVLGLVMVAFDRLGADAVEGHPEPQPTLEAQR